MYGNGSGFGIASLDPNACTEPVMKCPCETCRVMRDELLKTYNDQVEMTTRAENTVMSVNGIPK